MACHATSDRSADSLTGSRQALAKRQRRSQANFVRGGDQRNSLRNRVSVPSIQLTDEKGVSICVESSRLSVLWV